jgi:hypothetical protein
MPRAGKKVKSKNSKVKIGTSLNFRKPVSSKRSSGSTGSP